VAEAVGQALTLNEAGAELAETQLALESLVWLGTLDKVAAQLPLEEDEAEEQALPLEDMEAKLTVAQLALETPV
jgi:hypothetical protein